MLRHITRPFFRATSATKSTAAQSQSAVATSQGEERIRKWITNVNSLATSPEAKTYVGQLTTVINFLNRKSVDNSVTIDWKAWSDKIITPGLVDQVQNNFNTLAKEEYQVDRIVNEVFSVESKALEQISKQMSFHTAVWLDNYGDYVGFLFELEYFTGRKDYTQTEFLDLYSGIESVVEELIETQNYIPGSKDDINLYGYMAAQFAWGKKVISFYRHPSDDFKCGKATKNVLGR